MNGSNAGDLFVFVHTVTPYTFTVTNPVVGARPGGDPSAHACAGPTTKFPNAEVYVHGLAVGVGERDGRLASST
jgi:hypothetical protein